MAGNSIVKVAFIGDSAPLVRATAVATGALDKLQIKAREVEATSRKSFLTSGSFALGLAAVGVASLKAAGNFQTLTTQLVTGAGESQKNLKIVSDGMLKMAGDVGISADDLAKGMYLVESAGFHGAAGLKVLETAAEGAKTGQADMTVVANALTSALNAYHLPASKAVGVTNLLVAAEKDGKLHMEQLASALSGILPVAAAAHVSMAEVTGAIATMSMKGTDATVAATYLRQTIGQLENPTKKARNEMAALGLSAVDIAQNLGKRGLTGTLEILSEAVTRKMGPSGAVMLESLRKASGETGKFQKALNELPPAQQTYVGALATMVGGTKSMQAALQLTGPSMATFRKNVQDGTAALGDNGKHVEGWALIQQTFNQKLQQGTQKIASLGIELGTKLMPPAIKMLDTFTKTVGFFERNWRVIGPLVKVFGILAVSVWAVNKATAAVKATQAAATVVMRLFGATAATTAVEVEGLATAEVAATAELTGFAAVGAAGAAGISGLAAAAVTAASGMAAFGASVLATTGPIAIVAESVALLLQNLGAVKATLGYVIDHPFATSVPGLKESSAHRTLSYTLTHPFATSIPKSYHQSKAAPYTAHAPQTPDDYGQKAGRGIAAVAAASAGAASQSLLGQALAAGTSALNAQAAVDASNAKIKAAAKKQADAIKAAGKTQADAIQAASDAMKQALADRQDTAKSIRDSLISSNSVVRDGLSWTAKDLLSRFQTQMSKVKRFSAAIQELVRKGYSATIVRQVADAGVAGGMGTAIGLAHASAGQVRQFNAVQGGIESAAGYAGGAVAGQMGPIQIVTKVMLNDRELATAVNNWNRQAAATGHR